MANNKMKIIFMGTPEFGAIILEGLVKGGYKPILIITETDKPVGREQIITPPPAKISAQKYNIPVIQPEILANSKSEILNSKPDLITVAAYGQILPKEILEIPKYGCLNVHPSLLPRWRGPTPIQYAILNGDKKTGVTIILMDEKMDHGKIVSNSKFLISNEKITYPELSKQLAEKGARLLVETIPKWIKGGIKPKPQDDTKATFTKILSKEDGKINWRKNAQDIEREIRAFNLWPGSYTLWNKAGRHPPTTQLLRIKILKARVLKSTQGIAFPNGKTLVVPQNEIAVQCGEGFLSERGNFLVIERLQLEGKKEMGSEEFLRGHPDFIGTILK